MVLAFAQALKEMEEEGGIPARAKRYEENNHLLIQRMAEMGIHPYIGSEHQGTDHHHLSVSGTPQFLFPGNVSVY